MAFANTATFSFESLFPGGMPPLGRAAVRARINIRDQGKHGKMGVFLVCLQQSEKNEASCPAQGQTLFRRTLEG